MEENEESKSIRKLNSIEEREGSYLKIGRYISHNKFKSGRDKLGKS